MRIMEIFHIKFCASDNTQWTNLFSQTGWNQLAIFTFNLPYYIFGERTGRTAVRGEEKWTRRCPQFLIYRTSCALHHLWKKLVHVGHIGIPTGMEKNETRVLIAINLCHGGNILPTKGELSAKECIHSFVQLHFSSLRRICQPTFLNVVLFCKWFWWRNHFCKWQFFKASFQR